MTRTTAAFLLNMALWIAPAHRREWIEGLRAEADLVPHPAGWAWGALLTAVRTRLVDTLVSRLALRAILGGFVICVAAGFAVFLAQRIPGIEAAAALTHRDLRMTVLILAAATLLLASGGLAIVFSSGASGFNRYGRALFALGGLWIGASSAWTGYERMQWPGATASFHQAGLLLAAVGPLFITSALALLFRRGRLFLILASGALGMELAQYGAELPRLDPSRTAIMAAALFNACAPALLLLAGSGLLIARKTPARA